MNKWVFALTVRTRSPIAISEMALVVPDSRVRSSMAAKQAATVAAELPGLLKPLGWMTVMGWVGAVVGEMSAMEGEKSVSVGEVTTMPV